MKFSWPKSSVVGRVAALPLAICMAKRQLNLQVNVDDGAGM